MPARNKPFAWVCQQYTQWWVGADDRDLVCGVIRRNYMSYMALRTQPSSVLLSQASGILVMVRKLMFLGQR